MEKFTNFEYLDDITGGDSECKIRLMEVFLSQTENITEKFNNALQKNDVAELGKIGHLAKSTLRVMGITEMSDKMYELEQLAKANKSQEECKPSVNYYLEKIMMVNQEIKQEIIVLKSNH